MDNGVVEVLDTVGAGFKRVALYVGVVHGTLEPLSAEIAFELIWVDIVDVWHVSYYRYDAANIKINIFLQNYRDIPKNTSPKTSENPSFHPISAIQTY